MSNKNKAAAAAKTAEGVSAAAAAAAQKEVSNASTAATTAPVEKPASKPIVPVDVQELGTAVSVTPYKSTAVAEFGNKFLVSLVMQAGAEEEAQKLLNAAGEAKQFLSFEMTRAIFDLSVKFEDDGKNAIDVYSVFGEAKDVEKLNNRVLIKMGVLKKEISDDDTVKYVWTDEGIENLYSYTKALKDANPAEYDRRFNNRKRLNMRLNEAYRATAILRDQGLSTDDLFYSEDDNGSMVPTIRNAPKAVGGEAGIVQMNQRKPVKGATLSPTMSSLVKLANDKHKAPKGDRADKGENRSGEAKLGIDDETFGRMVNTLRQAISAQENVFTADMVKHIKALYDFLEPVTKIAPTAPVAAKPTE